MSKHYDAPIEVRELEKLIADFARIYGNSHATVFRDFLRYVINGWTIPGYPGYTDWPYSQEHNQAFTEMHQAWVRIMDVQLKKQGSYDVFALLYPAYNSEKDIQAKGQFMTPPHIAELMAELVMGDEKSILRQVIDPTGGSGGLLIAAHAKNPRNFYVSLDVDHTMCLQAVCNFLIHGVVGIVVCINTITMKDFQGAWLVNESLYRTGLPSIRPLTEQEYQLHNNSDKVWLYFLDQETYDMYEAMHIILHKITK